MGGGVSQEDGWVWVSKEKELVRADMRPEPVNTSLTLWDGVSAFWRASGGAPKRPLSSSRLATQRPECFHELARTTMVFVWLRALNRFYHLPHEVIAAGPHAHKPPGLPSSAMLHSGLHVPGIASSLQPPTTAA